MSNIPLFSIAKNKLGKPGFTKQEVGLAVTGRRFDQIYDSTGKPLNIQYDVYGQPIVGIIEAGTPKNTILKETTPIVAEGDDNDGQNVRPYIYDMYGLDLNDPHRAPWFASNIIYRDTTMTTYVNNIKRKLDGDDPVYDGPIFDRFGNEVIGIKPDNTLIVKQHSVPIDFDRFYRPLSKGRTVAVPYRDVRIISEAANATAQSDASVEEVLRVSEAAEAADFSTSRIGTLRMWAEYSTIVYTGSNTTLTQS